MKRGFTSQAKNAAQNFTIFEDKLSTQLGREEDNVKYLIHHAPDENLTRPSKVRRHGSKILSVLRSLTNSASSTISQPLETPSNLDSVSPQNNYRSISPPPELPTSKEISKKISLSFLKMQLPSQGHIQSTVVYRGSTKARQSLVSVDKGMVEITAVSASSGENSGNSGKSSNVPARNISTNKTSIESKYPGLKTIVSGQLQHSADKKTTVVMQPVTEGLLETNFMPPQEAYQVVPPEPQPTIVTAEKAAAVKIFFECHYNNLFSTPATPRSIRRRELEGELHNDFILTPPEKDEKRRKWAQQESHHLRELRAMKARVRGSKNTDKMASSFEVVKVLGKGSFGVVRLVKEKVAEESCDQADRKEVYAMKVIRKTDMLRNSQEGHLRAERDFLVASEGSRWVVPLIASFQDTSNLYLVMDYMPGGDFLGLLIRDNILSEPVTKWYIAEMILCIEEAHSLKWIHRDIKPDNFLISASGHLKISDFGLAFDGHWSHDQAYYNNHRYSLLTKLGISIDGDTIDKKEGRNIVSVMRNAKVMISAKEKHEKKSDQISDTEGILNWRNRTGNRTLARSVVGTSQYMAPEVVRGERYDGRCDWWSVAVILYECLYGHTPFLAEEGGRAQTKANINNHKATFAFPHKPTVSSRCQDLIRRIIQEKPDRLCSSRYNKSYDTSGVHRDYAGRYVYPNDAEDIKSHRWFKDINWDHLYHMTPPFVPAINGVDDTHYFDEEDPISDFSTTHDDVELSPPTDEDLDAALRCFNREIQILARGYVAAAYDTVKLRHIEREIDSFIMGDEQKEYLRAFVRAYGKKDRKRPRDRLLRDKGVASKVLEVRKHGAFLGYSYRRIRKTGSHMKGSPLVTKGRSNLLERHRISVF